MDPLTAALQQRAGALQSAQRLAARGDDVDAADAAREFEAMLLGELMKDATKPLDEEGAIGHGPGTRLYQELFLEEVLRQSEGRLGLSQWIESELAPQTPEDDR